MTKYFIAFFFLLSITITNAYFFGLKEKTEQQPSLARETQHTKAIEKVEPVKLVARTDTESKKLISIPAKPTAKSPAKTSAKPTEKKSTKATIESNGIRYVKIPFNGKHIYVSSDYYTENGVRKPLSYKQAQHIAQQHGAVLPTKEMVDAIWKYADLKLEPLPLPAGPLMTKPVYFAKHNAMIDKQINKRSYELVAGHKKDIIRPQRNGRVTLYGWHRINGVPIQQSTNVHDDNYGDYANCLRLVKLQS